MQLKPNYHAALNPFRIIITLLLVGSLCFLAACQTTSPPPAPTGKSEVAMAEGVPGGVFVNTIEVNVKVAGVDTANRKLTLLLPDGEKTTVKVGPEAVNFNQIQTGDMVTATLTEETVIFLDKEGAAAPDGAEAVVALAPKGAQPGGVVAGTIQITATVAAIDPANRTATLRFEDGSTKIFPVRDDIDLNQRKVGEKVVFLITEMIAISVEKP